MSAKRYGVKPISEFIETFDAGVSVNGEDRPSCADEHGVLKVSAIGMGRFVPAENKAVLQRELPRLGPSVAAGDLIVTRANTHDLVGAAALVCKDYPHLHLSDKTWRARLRSDDKNTLRWLAHVLNSRFVRVELRRRATGTSGTMKNISQGSYLKISVPTPPQSDRGLIADVLDELALANDLMHAILSAKRRVRIALIRKLMPPTEGSWSRAGWTRMRLDRALSESRDVASNGAAARKLTVKLYGRGIIAKRDLRPGSRNTQYYRRHAGQFIYSKLDFLNGAFAIVPPELDGYESTLDLPAFDVSPDVNPRWLLHLFTWPGFYKPNVRLANGGRKARRVNPSELLKLVVAVPPRAEQDTVAALLDAMGLEIELLERLARAMDRQRQALLGKLLSGEIRLPAK